MDQQKCGGFGYQQGSQAFADCMMSVAQQRQAEQAAAARVAAANAAAQQRQEAAIRAAKGPSRPGRLEPPDFVQSRQFT